MNEYIVVSPRVGEPGSPFQPASGTNIEALLAGGFIARKPARQTKTQEPETITEEEQI